MIRPEQREHDPLVTVRCGALITGAIRLHEYHDNVIGLGAMPTRFFLPRETKTVFTRSNRFVSESIVDWTGKRITGLSGAKMTSVSSACSITSRRERVSRKGNTRPKPPDARRVRPRDSPFVFASVIGEREKRNGRQSGASLTARPAGEPR